MNTSPLLPIATAAVSGSAPTTSDGSPSHSGPRVDVAVVAYRSGELLEEALSSVGADPLVAGMIVVDHGDGADAAIARRCGARSLLDPSNPGFARGQNRAAGEGSSDYLLILNPDCTMLPGALSLGVDALDADSTLGAVAGIVRSHDGLPERAGGDRPGCARLVFRSLGVRRLLVLGPVRELAVRTRVGSDHIERVPESARDVEFLSGAALLVRRTAFEGIKGFDEGFFLYGEDVDLCRRLEMAGWRLRYLSLEWAHHVGSASSSDPWQREAIAWQGAMREASKWWNNTAFGCAWLASVVRWVTLAICRPGLARFGAARMLLAPLRDRRHLAANRHKVAKAKPVASMPQAMDCEV